MKYWYLKHCRVKKSSKKIPLVGIELRTAHTICLHTNNLSKLVHFLASCEILQYISQLDLQLNIY